MILIVGGAYQGKTDFACRELGISESKIFGGFHTAVKSCLEQGKSVEDMTDAVFCGGFEAIISDEIGCGIIPADEKERRLREAVGRALCNAAERCSQVWLVRCGIGVKIKG